MNTRKLGSRLVDASWLVLAKGRSKTRGWVLISSPIYLRLLVGVRPLLSFRHLGPNGPFFGSDGQLRLESGGLRAELGLAESRRQPVGPPSSGHVCSEWTRAHRGQRRAMSLFPGSLGPKLPFPSPQ